MIYVHFVAPDQRLFYKRYIYNVSYSLGDLRESGKHLFCLGAMSGNEVVTCGECGRSLPRSDFSSWHFPDAEAVAALSWRV